MCGRYTLAVEMDELAERFGCPKVDQVIKPRYNVAPSQIMPVVVEHSGQPRLQMMHWGLVPFWAKDKSIGNKLINARVETVEEKASFKYAVRGRRCIVPANGYYEWQKTDAGKQPMRIVIPSDKLFGFADLWEQWNSPDGEAFFSYTILTAPPVSSLVHIHHRMPFILRRDQEDYWLNGLRGTNTEGIRSFLNYLQPRQHFGAYPVSSRVNSPRNDDIECIEPAI